MLAFIGLRNTESVYVSRAMSELLPPELESFVGRAVNSGKYRTRDEVIQAALRLLEERERHRDALVADLRVGLDELDRGEGIDLNEQENVKGFFDGIKSRGRERLQNKTSPR